MTAEIPPLARTNSKATSMPAKLSIATSVILVIVTITLTLLSVAGGVGYHLFKRQQESELKKLNLALVQQAATGLALPLWNLDHAQILKTAESLMKVQSVSGVVIRASESGEILLALARDSAGEPTVASGLASNRDSSQKLNIVFSDEAIGVVQVWVTHRLLDVRLGQIRQVIIAFILVVAAILTTSLYLLLWRIIIKPVKLLENFSQQVDSESFDGSRLGSLRFSGELDSLRESIAKMVVLLESRFQAMQQEARRHSESEKRFRTLVDTIPDLIWLKDADGMYLSCNRMFERFFGAPRDEIAGKTDYDFVSAEQADVFRQNDKLAIEANKPTSNEEWITFAEDGRRTLLEATKTPMFDGDGHLVGVLGVGRDITERNRAEEERRHLDARMNNLQKLEALGVLVAGVAHNINNVLGAVMGTASLRESLTPDASDREAYGIIVTACRRGRDVVKSLMQFSRPTLSNQAPFEIHGLLAEVRVLLENTTRNRVQLVEAYSGEPIWIHGDAGSFSSALINLCLNSIDAMPEGGVIRLRTRVLPSDRVEVSVSDNGTGMTGEILARAKEPFFTTKEVGKGTGLGLSMTHGVVKAHGGTLEIASIPGHGTSVVVHLDRIPPPDSELPVEAPGGEPKSLTVLLVDDDPDIRFLVSRILKFQGHVIEAVAGGQQALDSLASGRIPDLVIMDQNMPGMDGIQTMAKIRALHLDLPILISSGQPDIQDWECFKQPKVAILSKPFDMQELMGKLAEFDSQG